MAAVSGGETGRRVDGDMPEDCSDDEGAAAKKSSDDLLLVSSPTHPFPTSKLINQLWHIRPAGRKGLTLLFFTH